MPIWRSSSSWRRHPLTSPLEANLRALSARQPELAAALTGTHPSPGIDHEVSSTGMPVPRVTGPGGRRALHSRVDPRREGERLAAAFPAGDYLVCLGLGGAYHLRPILARPGLQRLVVVERGRADLRALIQGVDMSDLFSDARVHVLAPDDPVDLEAFLVSDYHAALYRSFATAPLASRVETEAAFYGELADAIRRSLDAAARDHTVQTRFGLRWHRNIVANLRSLDGEVALGDPPGSLGDVLVAGAGPSLFPQLGRLADARRGAYLIATDASLTPLMAAGVEPDTVLSIDCQHVIYHHFFRRPPRGCGLVLDIASPPFLARLSERPVFLTTRHPLAAYLHARGAPFLEVDVSGGNVGYAAVSLADRLGARTVRLFGMDLCYPLALPYTRGSFFYAALEQRSSRATPLETAAAAQVLSSPRLARRDGPVGPVYLTAGMEDYRRSLERLCRAAAVRVTQEPGWGAPLELGPGSGRPRGVEPAREAQAGFAGRLIRTYADELRSLPTPAGPPAVFVRAIPRAEREVLATLLPIASALQSRLGYPEAAELLGAARALALEVVERALSSPGA